MKEPMKWSFNKFLFLGTGSVSISILFFIPIFKGFSVFLFFSVVFGALNLLLGIAFLGVFLKKARVKMKLPKLKADAIFHMPKPKNEYFYQSNSSRLGNGVDSVVIIQGYKPRLDTTLIYMKNDWIWDGQ